MNTPELKDHEFGKISRLVYEVCGIDLHEGKKELVKTRLGKRLRSGNFHSFSEYYNHVTTKAGMEELIAMIDSISTNLTSFFREESHFARLRVIVPPLLQSTRRNGFPPRLRIWSAGCSTGEEPYTIAVALSEMPGVGTADVRILATDISTRVLKTAVNAIYDEDRLKGIPRELMKKYFLKGQGSWDGSYRVKDSIRSMVDFKRLNLKEPFPMTDPFDVIFCRNVMIYFDKEMQGGVVKRFYNLLKDGGYLFIGHSESLTGIDHRFKYIEPSVYHR